MFTLNCKGKLLSLEKALVMGIINATPDSFYEGSRFVGRDKILEQAEKMVTEEVDIIDIGGQSTRPGSNSISAEEELGRVIEGIEDVHKKFPDVIISIDTYYSSVAKQAVKHGASIVNDISAGSIDKEMLPTVAQLKIPYVLMHMKGTPETMEHEANYDDVTLEVLDFFVRKKYECNKAGIHDIIVDPGFGFAKTIEQNFELLRNISVFKILDAPILVGVSRKSSIYKTLRVDKQDALNGTTVLNTIALMNGANILRVHDVKEAIHAVKLCSRVNADKDV
jgi:dihydropteroate synthase